MLALKSRFPYAQILPIALLAIAPACGNLARRDMGADARPPWSRDVAPASSWAPDVGSTGPADGPGQSGAGDTQGALDTAADLAISPDVTTIDGPTDNALLEIDTAAPPSPWDAADDLPDPSFSYLCGDGYICLAGCENRCGMHELGRSVCTCNSGLLHCSDCLLTDLARPQVPKVVTTMCAAETETDVLCSRPGDACYLHANWPYPDGCLCWPTPSGLVWGCGPVFGWFTTQ
jgi:hypothetical protein